MWWPNVKVPQCSLCWWHSESDCHTVGRWPQWVIRLSPPGLLLTGKQTHWHTSQQKRTGSRKKPLSCRVDWSQHWWHPIIWPTLKLPSIITLTEHVISGGWKLWVRVLANGHLDTDGEIHYANGIDDSGAALSSVLDDWAKEEGTVMIMMPDHPRTHSDWPACLTDLSNTSPTALYIFLPWPSPLSLQSCIHSYSSLHT